MDRTIIHVMRHGEVDNPDGVLYGRLPGFGLTELGHAMAARAAREGVDMPVVSMIVALIDGRVTVTEAAERLLNRPLKEE